MKEVFKVSRFRIHDDTTAPDESSAVLKVAQTNAGTLPNFLGVLAASPHALRAYTRAWGELRRGRLSQQTVERIALAVAAYYGSESDIALHSRVARSSGLGIDEVTRACQFDSQDKVEAVLLDYLKVLLENREQPSALLHEKVHEAGWDDEQIIEAIAVMGLESLVAMVGIAADIPVDGSLEEERVLKVA